MLIWKRKVKRNVWLQTNKLLFSALAKLLYKSDAARLHEIRSKIDVQTKRGNFSRQNWEKEKWRILKTVKMNCSYFYCSTGVCDEDGLFEFIQ